MAPKKNKQKQKQKHQKSSAKAASNGGASVTDSFETEASEMPVEVDEEEDSDEYDEDENEPVEPTAMDSEAIARLFPLAMKAEKAVEAAEKLVTERRAAQTEIVRQLKAAAGGSNGPFRVNGKRVQLRGRKGSLFLVWERAVELPNIVVDDEEELAQASE